MGETYGEYTRLASTDGMVGKTVQRAEFDEYSIFLLFTDGTFYVAKIEAEQDGLDGVTVDLDENGALGAYDLFNCDLVDKEEFQRLRDAEDEARRAETEAKQRAEYERLKAKFGGSPTG